jgi:hypothetical protein
MIGCFFFEFLFLVLLFAAEALVAFLRNLGAGPLVVGRG